MRNSALWAGLLMASLPVLADESSEAAGQMPEAIEQSSAAPSAAVVDLSSLIENSVPATPEQIAEIERRVSIVQRELGAAAKIDFNFSDASIKWLDGFIQRNRKHLGDDLVLAFGAYFGETIRVRYQCDWIDLGGGAVALRCPPESVLFPIEKVAKQVDNGGEDSIYDMYKAIPELLRRAKGDGGR